QANLTEGGAVLTEAELLASTRDARDLFVRQEIARRSGGAVPAHGPANPASGNSREAQTFAPATANDKSIPVVLKDGTIEGATCYAGAARIRASFHPVARTAGKQDELPLTLDVGAEPLLQSVKVRHVRLERAVDDL